MSRPQVSPDHASAATGTGTPLVSCHNVAHTYGSGMNAVVAVHSVTCDVLPADRIAVTGRSGSGKSTLLHLMAGLEAATAGVISWPGLGGPPLSRPGTVGLIFQGPSLLPALNAVENVTFPLLLAHTDEQQAGEQAWAAMHALGITELATKLPQELSGGQAQRVAVARALAGRPALILADEPTGQLDSHTAAHVMDVLLQAADDIGAGLLVSTHDPLIADRLPTRWDMSDGRIVTVLAGVAS